MSTETLRNGHQSASGLTEPGSLRAASETLEAYYQNHERLRGISGPVIRKAWFTMAHLLIAPGATVADMGCQPDMTYTMAALNPQINFIGVDMDKTLIKNAKKKYELPNLEYRVDNFITPGSFEENSLDGIINSFNLHEIFSSQKYSDKPVIRALETHFTLLKQEGQMFIRDYALMSPEEYVMLEMPDIDSPNESPKEMSEADLLVWYSEYARPQGKKGSLGFFLEELPPRLPQTRLFRLPAKWAYEFIMHKDDRDNLETELPKEYTFFTQREYRKNLRALGARVLYTSPQWDDAMIRERFQGHFRLYNDEGKPMGSPPTSFVAVAQKLGEKKSLRLHERRPSNTMEHQIRITAMRNEITGSLFDVVSRDMDLTEILPFRVTENGELNIFVHEGLPRGIANAVPRTGKSIDGKRWSGHMTEAIAVPTEVIMDVEKGEPKATVLFARDYLGLKPAMGSALEVGPPFFPAPDFIDEQIKTRYLQVVEHEGVIEPRKVTVDLEGFTTKGSIREVNAQSILNAISVGYIPNLRLEMQILALYEKLGIHAETWQECPLALDACHPEQMLDGQKFANDIGEQDKRFKNVKGSAGQLRAVKSIFVDEGWVEGGIEGLATRDIEFIISDDQTINKAVILPLTRDINTGDALAGMVVEHLPVPQRHKGNGLTLRAPSITLPKEVTTIDQAKKFIAEKFDVPLEKVARLGESYFCHIGVTPVRLFPFAIASSGSSSNPAGGPVQFAPLEALYNLLDRIDDWNYDRYFLSKLRSAYNVLGAGSEVNMGWVRTGQAMHDELNKSAPAIANATIVTKPATSAPTATAPSPVTATQAPAAPPPQESGLAQSGWSIEKARQQVEENRARAQSSYVSSPDFHEIRHETFSTGHIASTGNREASKDKTADNEKDHKKKSSS
ncbi:MAG: methyltransferase domain-containing protein [Rhodospirillales bacterium]|nr:methyltransferase domain-containing protein [Rhodospirillales bacterium]